MEKETKRIDSKTDNKDIKLSRNREWKKETRKMRIKPKIKT